MRVEVAAGLEVREVNLKAGDVYKAQGPAVVIEVVGRLRWKEGDDTGGEE